MHLGLPAQTDERGIALPLALITLAILSALMFALATLSASEPEIANNHFQSARARAFAESGLERAVWALSNPTAPGGLADPLPSSLPAAYDGTAFTWVEQVGGVLQGGFRLAVANPTSTVAWERDVTVVGFTPNETKPRAVKKLTATLMRIRPFSPPCAVCINGPLQLDGTTTVDARQGVSAVPAATRHCEDGPAPTSGSLSTGATMSGDDPRVFGPGNEAPNEPEDRVAFAPSSALAFQLTAAETAALKALAQSSGTYYRGAVTFGPGHHLPDGVVFVDTTTGVPFSALTADVDMGQVTLEGGPPWRGWLIVAGSLTVTGNAQVDGLLYAQDRLTVRGGTLQGALVAEHRKHPGGSLIEAATITYDCGALRAAAVPGGWFVRSGSYREVEGR
jgi:hypothetical protein